jgi:glutaredoxin 3
MIQRSHGGSTFPQVFINDRHVGGSDELIDLEAAGRLDGLLSEAAAA